MKKGSSDVITALTKISQAITSELYLDDILKLKVVKEKKPITSPSLIFQKINFINIKKLQKKKNWCLCYVFR